MLARALRTFASVGVSLGVAYAIAVRPRIVRWGATDDEVCRTLPGDDLVPQPRYRQTHAITVGVPPEDVWPWLVQMGQGRGGLYSYDRLQQAFGFELENVDSIVPELQRLAVGDEIRLVPADFRVPLRFIVATIEPERALVLRSPGTREGSFRSGLPVVSWAFVLDPIDALATRLIVRFRSDYDPTPAGLLFNGYGLEPVHFLMERKMLMGIRERAEQAAADRAPDKVEVDAIEPIERPSTTPTIATPMAGAIDLRAATEPEPGTTKADPERTSASV
jgi:hypothetical protein